MPAQYTRCSMLKRMFDVETFDVKTNDVKKWNFYKHSVGGINTFAIFAFSDG